MASSITSSRFVPSGAGQQWLVSSSSAEPTLCPQREWLGDRWGQVWPGLTTGTGCLRVAWNVLFPKNRDI